MFGICALLCASISDQVTSLKLRADHSVLVVADAIKKASGTAWQAEIGTAVQHSISPVDCSALALQFILGTSRLSASYML
jgi:hypothetical protein